MAETESTTLKTNGPHWEELSTLCIHPQGKFFAVAGQRPGGYPSSIVCYETLQGKHHLTLDDFHSHATALSFVNQEHLVSGHADGQVMLWDLGKKKPKMLAEQSLALGQIQALVSNTTATELYVAGTDGVIHVCELPSLKPLDRRFAWPDTETIHALVCDPQGKWIAAAGASGIIRVFSTAGGEPTRVMEGHEGPIYTLLLHPQELRLISAGEDRSIRLWYLQGDIEFEDRAANQAHTGPIRCMKLGPTLKDETGEILPPRLLTGSDDGSVKIWPLHNKRPPKTLSSGKSPVLGLDVALHGEGSLFLIAKPARVISAWFLNKHTEPEPEQEYLTIFSTFHNLRYKLRKGEVRERKDALKDLALAIEDPEVFEAILQILEQDKEPDIRALAALELVKAQHRRPIREIRTALNDKDSSVRKTALQALRQLQGETSVAPLESALQSQHEDTRCLAICELVPLQKQSPHAIRLIRQSLQDNNSSVQKEALQALETLYPSTSKKPDPTPLLLALQEGHPALKQEVLFRIYQRDWSQLPSLHSSFLQLIEDSNEQIRRTAFLVLLSGVPALREPLQILDDVLQRQFIALQEQIESTPAKTKTSGTSPAKTKPAEQKAALSQLQSLSEAEKQILFLGLSNRYPDMALRCAMLLARFHDLRALGTLLQLSQEKQAEFRKDTALALRYLSDIRAKDGLIQMLHDPEKEVRGTAYESLEHLCTQPLDVAQAAMLAPHADLRHRALQKLVPTKKDATLSDQTTALLELALSDADESVRNEAFKILWNAFAEEPQRVLVAALQSQQRMMRQKAIDEIRGSFAESAWGRKILLQTLHDPEEHIRQYAYDALVKMYPKDDFTPQKHALQTPHTDLRLQAIQQLHKAKKSELQPILLELLRDEDSQVRTQALERLLQKYPKDNETLVQALDAKHWDIRLQVAQHLATLGDTRALGVAEDYLEEEHQNLAALAKQYPTAPNQSLLEVLPAPEQERIRTFRRAVISLVKTLGHPDGIDHISSFLHDPQQNLALEAAHAFAQCADLKHRDELLDLLKHKQASFRAHARSGLARLGDVSVLPTLTEQWNSGSSAQQLETLICFHALGDAGFPKTLQALAHANENLRDHAWLLVLATEWAAARRGQTPSTLLQVLASPYPNLRLRAAEILQHRANRSDFLIQLQDSVTALLCNTPTETDKSTGSDKQTEASDKTAQQHTLAQHLSPWLAALTSPLPALRYAAASLLAVRDQLKTFNQEFPIRLRPWLPMAESPLSAQDQAASETEYHHIAFGTYAGLLRQDLPNSILLHALRRAFSLHTSPHCSVDILQPLLEQALHHPERVELRKAALTSLHQLHSTDSSKAYTLALSCPHTDVGLSALQLIAAESPNVAQQWTTRALQSPLRDVRHKAAEQLQKLYPEGSLEPFILALQSEHPDVRLRVIDRLLQEKDNRVTEALRQALSSDHDDLRLKAAIALAQRKENLAFDVLSEFLYREDARIQQQAIQAFLQLGEERAVQVIQTRCDNDPEQTADRSALFRSLGQLGFPSAADWLTQKLEDPQPHLRSSAYDALVQLAGSEQKRNLELYVSLLHRALQSKSADIVERALHDIAELKSPKVQECLLPLLKHILPNLRRHALQVLLERIPTLDTSYTPLLPVLEHRDPDMRREAAIVLGGLGETKAFPTLFTTFQTSMDPDEQRRAIFSLGKLGDTRAFATILAMFPKDDTLHPALDAACEAIGRLAPPERRTEIRQLLLAIVQQDQPLPPTLGLSEQLLHLSDESRKHAIVGLRYVAGKEGVMYLDKMARELSDWGDWPLRQAVAEELGELNDKSGEPTLLTLLQDDDSDVRRSAARSLIKLYDKKHARPYLLIYDNKAFAYEQELLQEAAEFIAKHADPVEILERLPRPNTESLPKELFLDLPPHNESDDDDDNDDDFDSSREEYSKVLEMGLLRRTPAPVSALLGGLKHPKLYIKINTIQTLMRLLPPDPAAIGQIVSKETVSTALQAANQEAITLWKSGKTPPHELSHYWQLTLWAFGVVAPESAATSAQEVLALAEAPATVRSQAAQLLGLSHTPDKEALVALQQALADPQEKVRRQAAWALSRLQKNTTPLLQQEQKLPAASAYFLAAADLSQPDILQQLHSHAAKREWLPALLSQRNSAVFIDLFQQHVSKPADQILAIDALGRIADPPALQHLDAWRTDQQLQPDVRLAAYRAWRRAKRRVAHS